MIDLLKGYFKIQERDNRREIRDKVIGRLPPMNRSLEALLPPPCPSWAAWWRIPGGRRSIHPSGVNARSKRSSICSSERVRCSRSCWSSRTSTGSTAETQALLDSLVDSLPTARLLLLVNYRPEYQHGWGSKTYYTQLRLEPLPPASAEELLARSWGTTRARAPQAAA